MFDRNLTKNQLLDTFDRMVGRIELLAGEQRAFVRLFQNIRDFRCIAQTAKMHEATVARRLKKIAQRISDDKFVSTLTGSTNSEVAKQKIIHGKSIRQIASETGMSRYKIKKIMNNIANAE
jgi:hypothetical protein